LKASAVLFLAKFIWKKACRESVS